MMSKRCSLIARTDKQSPSCSALCKFFCRDSSAIFFHQNVKQTQINPHPQSHTLGSHLIAESAMSLGRDCVSTSKAYRITASSGFSNEATKLRATRSACLLPSSSVPSRLAWTSSDASWKRRSTSCGESGGVLMEDINSVFKKRCQDRLGL